MHTYDISLCAEYPGLNSLTPIAHSSTHILKIILLHKSV